MVPSIDIMSQADAENFSMKKHLDKSIVIAINSFSGSKLFIHQTNFNNIVDILWLSFNDTEYSTRDFGGMILSDGDKVVNFLSKHLDSNIDRILVCCDGTSLKRPAGIAAAIAEYLFNDTSIRDKYVGNLNRLCYGVCQSSLIAYLELNNKLPNNHKGLNEPAYITLAKNIEKSIVSKDIKYQDTLPDIIEMADIYKYSVLTVKKAYEWLIARDLVIYEDNKYYVTYEEGVYTNNFDDSVELEIEELLFKAVHLAKKNKISMDDIISIISLKYNERV